LNGRNKGNFFEKQILVDYGKDIIVVGSDRMFHDSRRRGENSSFFS